MITTDSVAVQARPQHLVPKTPITHQDIEDALNAAFRKVVWDVSNDTPVSK